MGRTPANAPLVTTQVQPVCASFAMQPIGIKSGPKTHRHVLQHRTLTDVDYAWDTRTPANAPLVTTQVQPVCASFVMQPIGIKLGPKTHGHVLQHRTPTDVDYAWD